MGGRVASPIFVGRIEELELLEAARRRAADADPAVVLVGGEAGVGKTRLVAELTSRCANDGTRVLAGGCVPVGDGALPYAPIVEAMRALASDVGVGAVRELVGPSWRELARLLPALGAPETGVQPDQAAQTRLFELLLGLLGRLAELARLVVVVEDLHWADSSTRDLLSFLVRNLRRERILLVVTYRNDEPGQQRLGPYLAELDRAGRVERIDLRRLDQFETVLQLAGILGAAPTTDLVDVVFARSQGNPFFTEELLGVVRSGSDELPATLRDLLRGRVAALPDRARQVLAVVAVAGREVSHRLLAAAVVGLDDPALVEALRATVISQLLVTTPGGDSYQVRHALLREVIDADLLPGERARLHADLAQALTGRPELADGPPAVAAAEVAAHWDAAGEPTRALPSRVQAGLTAERARAFPEAQRHYERALEQWEQVIDPGRAAGLDRVELLTRAADAASASGRSQRALALLGEALDQLDPATDPVRAALLLTRLGGERWATGDEPGLAALEEAVRILPAEPSAERARVLAEYATLLMLAGSLRDAVGRAEQALAVARTVGARAEEGHALDMLGVCTRNIEHLVEARQIAEEVGNAEGIVRAYVNLGATLSLAGRTQEAVAVTRQGLAAARELGLEQAMGSFLTVNLAATLFELGDWEECDRVLAEALERESTAAFALHSVKGQLEVGRGDFQSASHHLELARQLNPAPFEAVWPLASLAELAIWQGRHDDARAAVDEAMRGLEQLQAGDDGLDLELKLRVLLLCALGLRAEADRAELARVQRSAVDLDEAHRRAEPLVATVTSMAGRHGQAADTEPWIACYAALAQAEWSRLEGRPDPEAWQWAAERCERLEHRYTAAYARFRQAEALLAAKAPRAQIQPVLRAAHRTTVALGVGPLGREIELLAGRGRLRLDEPTAGVAAPEAPPTPAASLGLTRREAEVLALVAAGQTNRQIGAELFITEKTASIHVSRILAKLGVAGRGQAAAVAHRLGLDR